jgi:hypothetical protein
MLEPPNLEVNVADLNLAAAVVNDTPHLARPPAIATPVSSPGREPAKEIPQIGVSDLSTASAANLISLPESPLRAMAMIILPPANQIAPSGAGNGGLGPGTEGPPHDGAQGTGIQGQGLSASGAGGVGTANAGTGDSGTGGVAAGKTGTGRGASTGDGGAGSSSSGTGAGDSKGGSGAGGRGGSGGSGGAAGPGGTLVGGMAGLTRLTLPKDGHYGVVVIGSATAAPYPESVGALSGKMVYTVYLRVGLRKNWILQYCLPKAAEEHITTRGSATPLDAPWPFLILRPDQLTAPGEGYVMVHGMITSEGQFDQLAMVFPEELEKKDLLISSLNKWEFRPASRDKVPTTVEVLLIIPRESD